MAATVQVNGRTMTARQFRSGWRWQQLAKAACPPGSICYHCHEPIVFGLRPNHPKGPSADHLTPLEKGGAPLDPSNIVPAHFGCNSSKSNRVRKHSRSW